MTTDNYQKHTTTSPLRRLAIENFMARLLDLTRALRPGSVLDVGCGEGFTLERLRRAGVGVGAGETLEGVEPSAEALALGRRTHPHLRLVPGSIYQLPYPDRSFDLVIATEVLEHLGDPDQALRELRRVARRHCLVSVPHEPWFTLVDYLRGQSPRDIGHVQHWTPWSFRRLLGRHLRPVAWRLPFPWTMVLAQRP
jgi:SAM-dependent methyltransferase